jgi:hypothetical protein
MDALRAAQEALFCEQVLAKSGDNVLLETLRGASPVSWQHYPPGDVYDAASGGQWYYHCHDPRPDAVEHGHFHCFVRPDGPSGPIHHVVAVGVDPYGRLVRLFTVNQWVVGDVWAEAETLVPLLPRFDMHHARPSYLVNRWLTAVVALYGEQIAELIRQRDIRIAAQDGPEPLADRTLEVTSEIAADLSARAREVGAA